jgi:hypothetical protein
MPMAPVWCIRLAYNANCCPYDNTQLPHGPVWCVWLPYGSWLSPLVYTTPKWWHTPPIWLQMALIWCTWLPYSSHCFHMAPIQCIQLPYGASCLPMVPSGSHMAPICHTWLQHGADGSHMVPTQYMWLPDGTICLQYGAHGTHTVHAAPTCYHLTLLWCLQPTFATPEWCHLLSKWHDLTPMWLQFGTHSSQMAQTP